MPPPRLTETEWLLAFDIKLALTAVHDRHRSERDAVLWLSIEQLELAVAMEMAKSNPDLVAVERVKQLRLEYLAELGLPPVTDTRRRAG